VTAGLLPRQFRSTGVEMVFDLNLLHFPEALRVGARYAYLLDYGNGGYSRSWPIAGRPSGWDLGLTSAKTAGTGDRRLIFAND
jgi:hypothetical protein